MRTVFDQWKIRLNSLCRSHLDLDLDDLPDLPFADWYENDLTPNEALAQIQQTIKEEFGWEE